MTLVTAAALGLSMLMEQAPAVDPQAAEMWSRVTPMLAAVALTDHENGEVLGTLVEQVERVEQASALPGGSTRLRVTLAPGGADRLRRSECARDAAAEAMTGYGAPFVCGEARRIRMRVADDRSHALLDVLLP